MRNNLQCSRHGVDGGCFYAFLAAATAVALSAILSATAALPGVAHAETGAEASMGCYLSQAESPFQIEDGRQTVVESIAAGDGMELTCDLVYTGNGTCTVKWLVSSDGGKTWAEVEGTSGMTCKIDHVPAGDYVYRAVLADDAGNSAKQDFVVHSEAAKEEAPAAEAQVSYDGTATLTTSIDIPEGSTIRWEVSHDGGITWETVEGGTGASLHVGNLPSGTTLYRVTVTDGYGNMKSQVFSVQGSGGGGGEEPTADDPDTGAGNDPESGEPDGGESGDDEKGPNAPRGGADGRNGSHDGPLGKIADAARSAFDKTGALFIAWWPAIALVAGLGGTLAFAGLRRVKRANGGLRDEKAE